MAERPCHRNDGRRQPSGRDRYAGHVEGRGQVLGQGLVDSAVYGLLGVVLQAVALRLLDAFVPGHLRDVVNNPRMTGTAWAIGASLVAIAAVNAAALS